MLILLKFWKELLLVVLLLGGSKLAYDKVKHVGYLEAETKYTLVIKDYQEQINKQIKGIEAKSILLVIESEKNSNTLKAGIKNILQNTKIKPLVIIKKGECVPSEAFIDTLGTVNRQVNKGIKR